MGFMIGNGVLEKYIEEDGVTEIVIPEGVTVIGEEAFGSCQRLQSVCIPESAARIGDGGFERCTSITSVTIPESVTSIGGNVFNG